MPEPLPEGGSTARTGRAVSSSGRRGAVESGTEKAPLAFHLLETFAMLDRVGHPSSRRRLRVVRRELLGVADDLERVGLIVLREAGASRGVWVSLSEAGRRLLTTGSGRGAE